MNPGILLPLAAAVALALAACSPPPAPPAEDPAAAAAHAPADGDYLASVEQWRREREERLRRPDGWLSFTGSGQVAPGAHRVGSAPDNAIVVPGGPANWGVLRVGADGALSFEAAADAGLVADGQPFAGGPLLTQLDEGGPTSLHAGRQRFYVVRTGDVHGWRFRDPESPALQAFAGVPHFPVDPAWRIEAQWQAYPQPRTIQLVTSNGTLEQARVTGQAEFELHGRRHTLLPVQEKEGDQLFFILADRTSGKETYGGGRFLYTAPAQDGRVVLDFNRAQNPPCALNGHVVCPTAPPENRLDLRIAAGEKTYPLAH
ncbi:DUF1684 domain-containing protein [Pseudoxanthomonas suwonensis]|uniref:Lipoprotein n=1 Tax=Pseudoxanthomonas suwonensis TaxID=314722 RepID=A0A0E3UPT5_9GAMM|nr:DUF1684 domain-containing protein [Pseudoxanthomonas suwonensis]AKC88341.1 hypothetical protein WQ53_10365 [Pseudoxanthomonas suwonensis]